MHLTSWVKSGTGGDLSSLDFDLDRLAECLDEITGMRWEISLWGEYVEESAGGENEAER
jgi:hypothetical protein